MSSKGGSRLVGVEVLREKGMDLEYVLKVESEFASGLTGEGEGPYLCRPIVMYSMAFSSSVNCLLCHQRPLPSKMS